MRQELIAQALGYGLVTYLAASLLLLLLVYSDAHKRGNRVRRGLFWFVICLMTLSAAVVLWTVLYKIAPQ